MNSAISPPPQTALGEPTSDDKTMALLCHAGGVFGGWVLPLVVWLIKKDQSPFVDDQGKEALNFQITVFIGAMACVLLAVVLIGLLLFPVLVLGNMVLSIMGMVAAQRGELYRYPINLRLIK